MLVKIKEKLTQTIKSLRANHLTICAQRLIASDSLAATIIIITSIGVWILAELAGK